MSTSVEVKPIWSLVTPYLIPPIAAGAAVIPVFYGFMGKSARQKGESLPLFNIRNVMIEGIKASPVVGVIIGIQMLAQASIEKAINKHRPAGAIGTSSMIASAMLVGAISAPMLAVFNGQSMGLSPLASLRKLTLMQSSAIIVRETSFLFAIRISDPVSEFMKVRLGDHKTVIYSAAFVSGVIGSLVGHPADTVLTCLQEGRKILPRHVMRGAIIRGGTIGAFSVFYKIVKDTLTAQFHT